MNQSEKILFLCTANYYRSRFSELYFNHLAAAKGLSVRADSAALEMAKWRDYNPGELSVHTIAALGKLGVAVEPPHRAPQQFDPARHVGMRLIALSETEHRPMVARLFPQVLEQVEFWKVEDVDFVAPEQAIALMRTSVESCLQEYQ